MIFCHKEKTGHLVSHFIPQAQAETIYPLIARDSENFVVITRIPKPRVESNADALRGFALRILITARHLFALGKLEDLVVDTRLLESCVEVLVVGVRSLFAGEQVEEVRHVLVALAEEEARKLAIDLGVIL